jgi:hypothetical protein
LTGREASSYTAPGFFPFIDHGTHKEVSQMRELFVEELKKVQGGTHRPGHNPPKGCGGITTLACCEEGPCSCC